MKRQKTSAVFCALIHKTNERAVVFEYVFKYIVIRGICERAGEMQGAPITDLCHCQTE